MDGNGSKLPTTPPLPLLRHFPQRGQQEGARRTASNREGKVMHYDNKNVKLARELRKNMTPWERKLWYCFLRRYPVRFYRQKEIGRFIADFYCPKASLVIELDGSGHYEPEAQRADAARSAELEQHGLMVLRFSNLDVDKSFEGVCTMIDLTVKERSHG